MNLPQESFEYGFYDTEKDGAIDFRWCSFESCLLLPDLPGEYLFITLYSDFSFSQTVECYIDTTLVKKLCLAKGWETYVIPRVSGKHLIFKVDKKINKPHDSRTMTFRFGTMEFSDTSENAHTIISYNKSLNFAEFEEGKTILKSYPVRLGIDIHGVCNMRPACVYCHYEYVKNEEGAMAHAPFNKKTLEEYGPFFIHCAQLTNCSVGEPFLSSHITELLEAFEKNGKTVEISTNGLLLNKKNRSLLLGKNINLYISIDAATPETYAKLRTDRFSTVIDNVRALSQEKAGLSGPRIYLVFMPMHVNIHELEDFIKLCADMNADLLVLRPLDSFPTPSHPKKRGGHYFYYEHETFSLRELIDISVQAKKLAEQYGVHLVDQLNFRGVIDKELNVVEQDGFIVREKDPQKNDPLKEDVTIASTQTTPLAEIAIQESNPQCSPEVPQQASLIHNVFNRSARLVSSLRQAVTQSAQQVSSTNRAGRDSPGQTSSSSLSSSSSPSFSPSLAMSSPLKKSVPICNEPWEAYYILRAGIKFCCYGSQTMGAMDDYEKLWNDPKLQDIRAHLARGEFSNYCLSSKSCPLVRKYLDEHPERDIHRKKFM